MPTSYDSPLLAERAKWQKATLSLSYHFAGARDALARIRSWCPESRQPVLGAYALRNVQVASIEVLDFLRGNLEHGYRAARGEPASLPELRIGRWREVLDVSHPARPYNPHLALTPELADSIDATREELKNSGYLSASAAPDSENPLVQHLSRQCLKAEQDGAKRVGVHESIGLLGALADLTDTVSRSNDATPSLRAINQDLNATYKKLEEIYLQNFKLWTRGRNSADEQSDLARHAQDFQNIGLLRARMRREHNVDRNDIESEKLFLSAVDIEWETYHTLVKPAVWFATLLKLTPDEIERLSKTVQDAKIELSKVSPTYGSVAFTTGIKVAVGPLTHQLTTARERAPFLQRHRQKLLDGGNYVALAALAYSFNVLTPLVLGIGMHYSPTRELANHIKTQVGALVSSPKFSVFQPDVLKEAFDDAAGDAKKELLAKPAKSIRDKIASAFGVLFHRAPRIGTGTNSPAQKLVQAHTLTLSEEIAHAANALAISGWREFQNQNRGFLKRHGKALGHLLGFASEVRDSLDLVNQGRRAQQELTAAATYLTPNSDAQRAYVVRVKDAEVRLAVLKEQADREWMLHGLTGFNPSDASPQERFWSMRAELHHSLAQKAWDDASPANIAAHSRKLSHVQVRHDPSVTDAALWEQINREDKLASHSPLSIPGFSIGERYHHSLPPTLHFHIATTKAVFNGSETNARLANDLIHLAIAGNLTNEIREVAARAGAERPIKNAVAQSPSLT